MEPTTQPKQWYRGTDMQMRAPPLSMPSLAAACRLLLIMPWWERAAPFGRPVVPWWFGERVQGGRLEHLRWQRCFLGQGGRWKVLKCVSLSILFTGFEKCGHSSSLVFNGLGRA